MPAVGGLNPGPPLPTPPPQPHLCWQDDSLGGTPNTLQGGSHCPATQCPPTGAPPRLWAPAPAHPGQVDTSQSPRGPLPASAGRPGWLRMTLAHRQGCSVAGCEQAPPHSFPAAAVLRAPVIWPLPGPLAPCSHPHLWPVLHLVPCVRHRPTLRSQSQHRDKTAPARQNPSVVSPHRPGPSVRRRVHDGTQEDFAGAGHPVGTAAAQAGGGVSAAAAGTEASRGHQASERGGLPTRPLLGAAWRPAASARGPWDSYLRWEIPSMQSAWDHTRDVSALTFLLGEGMRSTSMDSTLLHRQQASHGLTALK